MSNKPDGGPAFPMRTYSQDQSTGISTMHESIGGMTMRDYFASDAMKGMLSCQDFMNEICRTVPDKVSARAEISRLAYSQADAMLAERAK